VETNPQLLVLAKRDPLRALHVSAGRLSRIHEPEVSFVGVYIPSTASNEYTALLNEAANEIDQRRVLRLIVEHHAEQHTPLAVCVFGSMAPTCAHCDKGEAVPELHTEDYHQRTMRRKNWG
jgi:hypothetical protein